MKKILILIAVAGSFSSCKKGGDICEDGCYGQPARFYFIITDNQGKSAFTLTTDGIGISHVENNQLVQAPYLTYPQKVLATSVNPSTGFIVLDQYMALKSKDFNIKTFYLTYQGKTDTLSLDIHKVPATRDNGGNSTAIVTFDGRLMQSVPGNSISTPDYYVLKRR